MVNLKTPLKSIEPAMASTKGGSLSASADYRPSCCLPTPTNTPSPTMVSKATTPFDRTAPASHFSKEIKPPLWKGGLDWMIILISSPLWVPVMIVISLWIRSTGGPVFFRQTRIGLNGVPFTIFKFRTMKAGSETKAHGLYFKSLVENELPMAKFDSIHASRIIRGGRFLRATGLDELPQLFNVLRGEMSLVGPRPCTPGELECYKESQLARFHSLPGITGLWQVSGKNRTTFDRMVQLDIRYGQRLSLWRDLLILFKTFPTLASQALNERRNADTREHRQMELRPDTVRIQ